MTGALLLTVPIAFGLEIALGEQGQHLFSAAFDGPPTLEAGIKVASMIVVAVLCFANLCFAGAPNEPSRAPDKAAPQ